MHLKNAGLLLDFSEKILMQRFLDMSAESIISRIVNDIEKLMSSKIIITMQFISIVQISLSLH